MANQNVSVKISILNGGSTGMLVYAETQTVTSNSFGIINLNIGEGTIESGHFIDIDWSASKYFLKIEIDETGGNNYTLSGVSQLMSVPYALYADIAGNGFSGNYNDLINKPDLSDTSLYIKSSGSASQFLKANGSLDSSLYITAIKEVTDEFAAVRAQTIFILSQIPSVNSKVKMFINGIRISNASYRTVGDTLTYVPLNNGSYLLVDGDRIQFDYYSY